MAEEKKLSTTELFNNIDINYVNHNLMISSKTPAYVIIFWSLPILPFMFGSMRLSALLLVLAFILHNYAKKLQESKQSISYIKYVIQYIFKPDFYLPKKGKTDE